MKADKKGPLAIIIPIILVILFLGVSTGTLDYFRIQKQVDPIFCIKVTQEIDEVCYGIGYMIKRELDPYKNNTNRLRYYFWFSDKELDFSDEAKIGIMPNDE